MTSGAPKNIVFLTLIIGRNQKDAVLKALPEVGARLMNITYGKGSVDAGNFMCALGLVPEKNKVVITCLVPAEKSDTVFKVLEDKFNFNTPNTGIAYTIPVDKVAF